MNFFEKKVAEIFISLKYFLYLCKQKNQLITIKIKDIWQKPISIFAKNITLFED